MSSVSVPASVVASHLLGTGGRYEAGTFELEDAAVSTHVPLSGLLPGQLPPRRVRMSAALFNNSEKRLLRRDRAMGGG